LRDLGIDGRILIRKLTAKFNVEQATRAQRGSRGIVALLFL
jgi:hypothetical protein